jgi:hypothetical protein
MAKKARPAAGSPNAGKLNLDRVGTLATAIVDLMPKLFYQADFAVERGAEFRISEPSRVDSMMNQTRKLLEALADLLTKAVPLERERMAQRPYQTDYGTRLEFREPSPSETKYQPGNWTESERAPVLPVLSGQYPPVMDELREKQEASPTAWLYSARGAVLTYAADFWWEYGFWIKLNPPKEVYTGWPLDLPAGQRLVVSSDIFRDADDWLGWGRCAADFPRLINDAAVREWIKLENPTEAKRQGNGNKAPEDDSGWVQASTLWRDKFTTNKELTKFRKSHPDLFRNPSRNRLEIHAAKWTEFWARKDLKAFDSLDDSTPSIADDPKASEDFIAGAATRIAEIRKKKARKQ